MHDTVSSAGILVLSMIPSLRILLSVYLPTPDPWKTVLSRNSP